MLTWFNSHIASERTDTNFFSHLIQIPTSQNSQQSLKDAGALVSSMATTIAVPYFAADIPAALPSEAEIDASPDLVDNFKDRRIVSVGDHFVVKYGGHVNLLEGENLLFLREHTSV